MTRLLRGLHTVLAAVLIVVGIALCILLKDVDGLVIETHKRVVDTSQNVNALLIQAGLVADNVRRASESQEAVGKKTIAILGHTDDLITSTQNNVERITAHADTTLDGFTQLEAAVSKTLETGVVPTLNQLQQTIASIDKNLLQDPDIKLMLSELAKTSEHVDQSTDHIDHMIAYMDSKLTGPPTVKGRVLGALEVIYKLAMISAVVPK